MPSDIEIKIDLQEKIAKLYACLDKEDVDGYMAFFSQDASFESTYGTMSGREVIRKFMEDHVASGMENGVRHFLSNFIYEIENEVARIRFYALKMQVKVGPKLMGSAIAECHFDLAQTGTPLVKISLEIDEASLTQPE